MSLPGITFSNKRQPIGRLILLILMIGCLPSYLFADEIQFKNIGAHKGTILEEDEQTVTIRFSKEAIKSLVRTQKDPPLAQKSDRQVLEKLDQLQKRIESLEKKEGEPKRTGLSPVLFPPPERKPDETPEVAKPSFPDPSRKTSIQEQLLQEELGSVQGVILWQGKPLNNGKVRIELEKYTGASIVAAKKMLTGNETGSSEADQGISLTTQTDSQGRYGFEKVPPGTYRLYWWPDFKTGWIHRLREKPDFEVLSGRAFIQNIPENPSILKVTEKK
jgi:hypothetical protein